MQRPPYDATAVRPTWSDLPGPVRALVSGLVGVPVEVRSAGGGFTRGFAAALTDADGRTTFVKAVPASVPHIASSYRREARVHAVLPGSAPTPRLLHEAEVDADGDEWVVLVLEHVEGRMPGLPWTSADLVPTVRALEQLATSVRGLDWHEEASVLDFAEGDDLVGLWSAYDASWLPDGLGTWVPAHADELRAATEHAAQALRGDDWTHADIRGDNLLVGDGRAWVVDWNWLCRGPAWVDLALLLPMVHVDGVDLGPAYGSWLLADVPAADLDAAIAWLGALMLAHVDDPVFPGGSPWLRPHQRWTGAACLSLLRERWTASSGAADGR
ncbi:MAG: phosphotransferase [Candidatus Nanopelagicales bacterium]